MRKIILCIALALLACACGVLGACKNKEEDQQVLTGEYTLNGFNNLDDLYDIKLTNLSYSTEGSMDINDDADYIKEGEGSLRLEVRHQTWPELYTVIENTKVPDMDVTDIKNLKVWVYNAGEDTAIATINVAQGDITHLLTEEVELPAKEWTECVLEVNAVVTKYAKDIITGFSLQFNTETPEIFYIDDLRVEFGSEFSEDDNENIAKIEEIIAEISAMPTTITAEHEDSISAIYNKYNALPDLYKSAVNNYSKLQRAMTDMIAVRNIVEKNLTDASENRAMFYFDKFYGMAHLSTSYGTKVNFAYSTDIKYGDEDGTTVIKFLGDVWNYIDFSNSVTLGDYDYVEFALYNDGLEKAIWLNSNAGWNNRTQVKTGEWVTLQVPVTSFNSSGAQLIITTSVNMGTASRTDGNLYISEMRAVKLGEKNMYVPALNESNPILSLGNNVVKTDDKYTVTASTNGDLELLVIKEVGSVNVSQNVVFSLNISKATSLSLLGSDGKTISNGTVAVSEGWNTVALTPAQYNSLSSISLSAEKDEQFIISPFYVIRNTDMQGMRLILEKDYLPELSAWTVNDLPQAIDYMLIYNETNFTNLKKQFVKVSMISDLALNLKQEAEYSSITTELDNRAKKIKGLMETLINSIDLNDSDVESRYLLKNAYDKYTSAYQLSALSTDYTAKAQQILAQLEYMPYKLLDVSLSTDRAKIMLDPEFFPWTGKISAIDGGSLGTLMGVTANEFTITPTGESHNNLSLKYDVNAIPSDYDHISFKLYNPTKGRTLYFVTYGWGATVKSFSLLPEQWNEIFISTTDFKNSGFILLTDVGIGDTFKFDDFYAYNEKYVQNLIDTIPDATELTLADQATVEDAREAYQRLSASSKSKVTNLSKLKSSEAKIVSLMIAALPAAEDITALDYSKIMIAKNAYDALSSDAQALVSNKAKINDLIDAYEARFVVVGSMQDKLGFSVNNDGYGNGDCTTLSLGVDAEYGNYLSAYISGVLHEHLVLSYDISKLSADISSCATVVFYVYNGNVNNKYLLANFGGTLTPEYALLTAGEWTKIEVPTADFTAGTYFGIFEVNKGSDPCEYKFSAIYGETDANDAANIVQQINALPEESNLTVLDGSQIYSIKSAYDRLSEQGKQAVTNVEKLLSIVSAYETKFTIVDPMNDSSIFRLHSGEYTEPDEATITYGTDSTYGKYMSLKYIQTNAGSGHAVVVMNFSGINLSDCDKVYMYVYNGGTANRSFLTNIGGFNASYKTLVAGEWTLVEFKASDFVAGKYIGIIEAQDNTEYKFSMVWATKATVAVGDVVALINGLPTASELTGLDYNKILTAKQAYEALPESVKSLVTNYSALQALETAYSQKFAVVFDMSDISGFSINNNSYGNGNVTTLTKGYDAEYGNYLSAYMAGATHDQLAIKYSTANLSTLLAGCDKVYFYVYNGYSEDKGLFADFNDTTSTKYKNVSLTAKDWTLIEVPVDEFLSGSQFGVAWVAGYTVEFKFSMVFATKTNA